MGGAWGWLIRKPDHGELEYVRAEWRQRYGPARLLERGRP